MLSFEENSLHYVSMSFQGNKPLLIEAWLMNLYDYNFELFLHKNFKINTENVNLYIILTGRQYQVVIDQVKDKVSRYGIIDNGQLIPSTDYYFHYYDGDGKYKIKYFNNGNEFEEAIFQDLAIHRDKYKKEIQEKREILDTRNADIARETIGYNVFNGQEGMEIRGGLDGGRIRVDGQVMLTNNNTGAAQIANIQVQAVNTQAPEF